jgi:hypothetical protein
MDSSICVLFPHPLLPCDIWHNIVRYLSLHCVSILGRVDRILHLLLMEDVVWEEICVAKFGAEIQRPGCPWWLLYKDLHQQQEVILPFKLLSTNGRNLTQFHSCNDLHSNNGRVYCSQKASNITLVFMPTSGGQVLVTKVVCKTPSQGYTSRLQSFACIFTNEPVSAFSAYNALFDGPVFPCEGREIPAAGRTLASDRPTFFEFPPNESFTWTTLDTPRLCMFVVTRLFHGLGPENIDTQFLGFVGKYVPASVENPVHTTEHDTQPITRRTFHHSTHFSWGGAHESDTSDDEDGFEAATEDDHISSLDDPSTPESGLDCNMSLTPEINQLELEEEVESVDVQNSTEH